MRKAKEIVGRDLMERIEEQEEPFDLADLYYEQWRDEQMEAEGCES